MVTGGDFKIIESWEVPQELLDNMFPVERIKEILGTDPGIRILRDDEVRDTDPQGYNIPVMARAFNESMDTLLNRHYQWHKNSTIFEKLLKIRLPQLLWMDSLGFIESVLSLHLAKLRKDELFLNDVVIKKSPKELLRNGIFDIILANMEILALSQNIKFVSGYAVQKSTFEIFERKGFKADRRRSLRNNILWDRAQISGGQFPFYKEIG